MSVTTAEKEQFTVITVSETGGEPEELSSCTLFRWPQPHN